MRQQRLVGQPADDNRFGIEEIFNRYDGGAKQRYGFGNPAFNADLFRPALIGFERQVTFKAATVAAGAGLAIRVEGLMADPARLLAMSSAAKGGARLDAAERAADLVEAMLGKTG